VPFNRSWLPLWKRKKKKTSIIIPQKGIVQPGDAYEDTAFQPGFLTVTFHTMLWSLSSSLPCEKLLIQLLILGSIPVSRLESESGFEIVQ
jgi:hypothetical protein